MVRKPKRSDESEPKSLAARIARTMKRLLSGEAGGEDSTAPAAPDAEATEAAAEARPSERPAKRADPIPPSKPEAKAKSGAAEPSRPKRTPPKEVVPAPAEPPAPDAATAQPSPVSPPAPPQTEPKRKPAPKAASEAGGTGPPEAIETDRAVSARSKPGTKSVEKKATSPAAGAHKSDEPAESAPTSPPEASPAARRKAPAAKSPEPEAAAERSEKSAATEPKAAKPPAERAPEKPKGEPATPAPRSRGARKVPSFVPPEPVPSNAGSETRAVLLVRDPKWLYAYWDLAPADEAKLRSAGAKPSLRLVEIRPDGGEETVSDIPVQSHVRAWYLRVPAPDRRWRIAIGLVASDGGFATVCASNFVQAPGWPTERAESETRKDAPARATPSRISGMSARLLALSLGAAPMSGDARTASRDGSRERDSLFGGTDPFAALAAFSGALALGGSSEAAGLRESIAFPFSANAAPPEPPKA